MRILTGFAGSLLVIGSLAIPAVLAGPARADTAPSSTLYVDQSSLSCSDSGPGSQAVPFCTIQAAANIVTAGQTVDIEAGESPLWGGQFYQQPLTITTSGTEQEPITFQGVPLASSPVQGSEPIIEAPSAQPGTTPVTIKGAQYVNFSSLGVSYSDGADGVSLIGSSHITLDSDDLLQGGDSDTASETGLSIDGTSSDVTVSRTKVSAATGTGILVQPSAAGVTVTTNDIMIDKGAGVDVEGPATADVTSNTVNSQCGNGVEVTGGTTATIENNVLAETDTDCPSGDTTPGADLTVDAASAATVQENYDSLYATTPATEYSWSGAPYADAADFTAATGQGKNDADVPKAVALGTGSLEGSEVIESADCGAPGELLTSDLTGRPRVADPLATPHDNGNCYADRGASQWQDVMTFGLATTPTNDVEAGQSLSLTVTPRTPVSSWGESVTYSASFGDGTGSFPVTPGSALSHTYTTAGEYALTITATDTSGSVDTVSRAIAVGTVQQPTVQVTATPLVTSPSGAVPDKATVTWSAGADAWEISSVAISINGDGAIAAPPSGTEQWSFNPGVNTVKLTETDVLGRVSTATATVTVGDLIVPETPVQDYNRSLASRQTLGLSESQLHLNPADQRAVFVTVTVTGARDPGYVEVIPDGLPWHTDVSFSAGQSVTYTLLLPPGEEGEDSLVNESGGTVNVDVETIGAETALEPGGAAPSGDSYSPVAPASVLPAKEYKGDQSADFKVAGLDGVPANATAVVLAVTSSHSSAAGRFVTYPAGRSSAQEQGGYWAGGQQVTDMSVVPVDGAEAAVENISTGTTWLSAQVVGYYSQPATGSVFIPTIKMGLAKVTIPAGQSSKLTVAGSNGVPATGTTAVQVNLTVLSGAAASGAVTAYADGTSRLSSLISLSYTPKLTVASPAIVAVGKDGAIDLYNGGSKSVTLLVDLQGTYYAY